MISWFRKTYTSYLNSLKKDDYRDLSESSDDALLWARHIERHSHGEFSLAVAQTNAVLEDHSQVEAGPHATFFRVYDGHGGDEASRYISDHLSAHLLMKTYTSYLNSLKEDDYRDLSELSDDALLWARHIERHSHGEFSVLEDHSQVEAGTHATFVGVYDGHDGDEASRYISAAQLLGAPKNGDGNGDGDSDDGCSDDGGDDDGNDDGGDDDDNDDGNNDHDDDGGDGNGDGGGDHGGSDDGGDDDGNDDNDDDDDDDDDDGDSDDDDGDDDDGNDDDDYSDYYDDGGFDDLSDLEEDEADAIKEHERYVQRHMRRIHIQERRGVRLQHVCFISLSECFGYSTLAKEIRGENPHEVVSEYDGFTPHICWPWGVSYVVEYISEAGGRLDPLFRGWHHFSAHLGSVVMTATDDSGAKIELRLTSGKTFEIPKRSVEMTSIKSYISTDPH
ncbi:hypothetical protein OROGR_006705 [Orobanche gracilis]